ncbi:HSP18 transcriptional regulator [Actinosynnema sp. NPDC050436]|uniref:HSP18 transcriptional regulator n=1 Tax=Actinosynnema sp. NPDC050436 TaxID=3155659 RepID=UPI0033E50F63
MLAALELLRRLKAELTGWEPRLIEAARAQGTSWGRLAPALGVASRQAAERRYLRLRQDLGDTAEGRVRAERERRAGERAVAAWAVEHAEQLRDLGGRVAVVDVLVREALGSGDVTALPGPLAAAADRVADPELAAEIRSVTAGADAARRR